MKVLLFHNILWSHYKGVVFTRLSEIAGAHGFEITFVHIALTSSERVSLSKVDESFHNYPYKVLFSSSFQGIRWWKLGGALITMLREVQPDAVLLPGYERVGYWMLWTYCRLTNLPMFVFVDSTYRDHPRIWIKERVKSLFIRRCRAAFCYGQRSSEYLRSLGIPRNKILIRGPAAAMKRMLAENRSSVSPDWQTCESDTPKELLFVGRLSPEKGLKLLFEAFAQVAKEDLSLSLTLVGGGPMHMELVELADSLRITARIQFAGSRSVLELGQFYSRAYALILPSSSEPWGLVVNEAFGFGCPAIVSDACGCVPEMVKPSTGLTFVSGQQKSLVEAIRILTTKKAERAWMGIQCQLVAANFTPERSAEQLLAGLETALCKHVPV